MYNSSSFGADNDGFSDMSHDEYHRILSELNEKEKDVRLPVRILLGCLMFIGVIGNIHVLHIYGRFFKNSTYRNFVLTLSVIDFIGCSVSMPFEITDELLPYTFTNAPACKIFRYLNTFVAISCGLTLVLVATERYRKICRPYGKQLTETMSIYCIVAVMITSALLTSPALYIYGLKTIQFHEHGVNGTGCTWGDHAQGSNIGLVYFGTLVIVVIACMFTLSVLYSLVGIKLRAHTKEMLAKLRQKDINIRKFDERLLGESSQQVEQKDNHKSLSKSCGDLTESDDEVIALGARQATSCEILCDYDNAEPDAIMANGRTSLNQLDKQNGVHSSSKCNQVVENLADDHEGNVQTQKIQTKIPTGIKTSASDRNGKEKMQNTNNDIANKIVGNYSVQMQSAGDKMKRNMAETEANSEFNSLCVDNKRKLVERSPTRSKFIYVLKLFRNDIFHSNRARGKVNSFKEREREKRVTKVLFTITMLFILSFIPYIVLLIVYVIDDKYTDTMTSSQRVFYLMSLRLYNLNCAANSILYILFDMKFRKEVINMYVNLHRSFVTMGSRCFSCIVK